jgi:hypothetical protein
VRTPTIAERPPLQKTFSYNLEGIANLETALSRERLSPYLAACNGDQRRAIALYEWNSTVSAAFYIPLQNVEIALRNACHRELTPLFGPTWHDQPNFLRLDPGFTRAIDEAKERLRSLRIAADTPNLVGELSFGFWTILLAPRFEPVLWIPGLRKAFPRFRSVTGIRLSRPPVAQRFHYVRKLRNQVAHHVPIFNRALITDYASLLETISWMYADLAEWSNSYSTCADLISQTPPNYSIR